MRRSATFTDRTRPPDAASLSAVLGPALELWDAARDRLAAGHGPLEETWAWSGSKAGWTLRLAARGRPVAYLTPLAGGCRGSLALSDRAVDVARAELDGALVALVEAAPRYPEGRAVRITLTDASDVDALVALASVRMRT